MNWFDPILMLILVAGCSTGVWFFDRWMDRRQREWPESGQLEKVDPLFDLPMRPITIYLAGPINGRNDADAKGWRERAAELWAPHGVVLDPMRRDYRGREHEDGIAQEIVDGDLDDLDQSDGVLVYFDKPSVGTAMEVFYSATFLQIPVVVVNASGAPLSPWMAHHADDIVETVEKGVQRLRMRLVEDAE